jgi:hypothetical protein
MSKIEEGSFADAAAPEQTVDSSSDREVRSAILHSKSANPALQRLKGRILAQSEASEIISSYDRMHHRHNRS